MLVIREETPGDRHSVAHVNRLAFGQTAEASLVDALRRSGRQYISLVAELDGRIVGHIFFSPIAIHSDNRAVPAMALAPVAVLPDWQRQGIGSQLCRAGLDACRRAGHRIVIVLGHQHYYPRFGFVPTGTRQIRCEFPVPEECFMVAELAPDALEGVSGVVKYPPEFAGA